MPAVMLVLALCLAGGQLATTQLRVQDAASSAARAASRGEGPGAVDWRVRQLLPGASVTNLERDGLVCAAVRLEVALPASVSGVTLKAFSCALAEAG